MNLYEIKAAIEKGQTVCWSNPGYQVIKDAIGQYMIMCLANRHCIGLTWADGRTLNGKEEDFFIDFDYGTIFNQSQPPAPPQPDLSEEQQREIKYQQSEFDKRWAPTYKEAVRLLVKQYKDAKKERDDWAARVYSPNSKRVLVRAWSEYDSKETTVYDANIRRQRNRVRSAETGMKEAIGDLRALGLTPEEINALLAL